MDQNLVEERFAALRLTRLEEDAYIRDYIVKNCAMHGSFLAPLSRMMILQKMDSGPGGTEKSLPPGGGRCLKKRLVRRSQHKISQKEIIRKD